MGSGNFMGKMGGEYEKNMMKYGKTMETMGNHLCIDGTLWDHKIILEHDLLELLVGNSFQQFPV